MWKIKDNVKQNLNLIVYFCILFVPNIICWNIFYPGYFQADHQQLIANIINGTPNQGNSLVWGYASLPFFYWSPSYAWYGVLQIFIYTICIIIGVQYLIKCKFLKHPIILICIMGLTPTFLFYNLLYTSEIILAYLTFTLTCILIFYVKIKNKDKVGKSFYIIFFLVLLLCCIIRKTALLMPLLIIIAFIILKDKNWKKFVLLSICCIVITFSIEITFANTICKENSGKSGAFSVVPSYQIAGVYAKGGYIDEESSKVFESIKTPKEWSDSYNIYCADVSGSNVEINGDFLKAYIKTFSNNKISYIKSYFRLEAPLYFIGNNRNMFNINKDNGIGEDFTQHDNFTYNILKDNKDERVINYLEQFNVEHSEIWHAIVAKNIEIHQSTDGFLCSIVDLLIFNRGLGLWILLLGLIFAIINKTTKDYLEIIIPVFSILFVFLLCCPVVLFRYVAEFQYALVIVIIYVIKMIISKYNKVKINHKSPKRFVEKSKEQFKNQENNIKGCIKN